MSLFKTATKIMKDRATGSASSSMGGGSRGGIMGAADVLMTARKNTSNTNKPNTATAGGPRLKSAKVAVSDVLGMPDLNP